MGRMSKMKKSMSTRELLLLGILIVITAYYFVIQGPIKRQTEELEAQKVEVLNQIAETAPVVEQKRLWQEAIDRVFAKNPNPQSISDYDNINNIIQEMHAIFDTGDNSYSIRYATGDEVKYEDNIVERWIRISFVSPSYEDALDRIQKLHDSNNRYQITDLNVSESGRNYSVSIALVDYEYSANYKK